MRGWQTPCLGLRDLPRELTEFELQAFFSFRRVELELIARRRGDNHKLGLALHIGAVRMSGRPLNSVRAVPAVLLRHLGQMLDIATPDRAPLRALYARGRTLFDHPQQACEALGFAWMSEHQRRALVRVLRDEVAHSADRERLLLHARHWLCEHRRLIVHGRAIRGLVAAGLTELKAAATGKQRQSGSSTTPRVCALTRLCRSSNCCSACSTASAKFGSSRTEATLSPMASSVKRVDFSAS